MKISEFFLSENFQFLEVKFSIYLDRLVFVMKKIKRDFKLCVCSGFFYSLLPFIKSHPTDWCAPYSIKPQQAEAQKQ